MPLRRRPAQFSSGIMRLWSDTSRAFGALLICKKREEHISPGFFVQMAAGLTVGLLHVLLVSLVHWSLHSGYEEGAGRSTSHCAAGATLTDPCPPPPKTEMSRP